MTSIQLPYGRGHLCFNLPEERLAGIIESRLDTYVPQGTPEELSENQIVREKYLSNSFVLRRKDFQLEK